MFSKLDERYDETVIFIDHNKTPLANFNLSSLQELYAFALGTYVVIVAAVFLLVPDFVFRPVYLLMPILLGVLWRLTERLCHRIKDSFEKVRVLCFIAYFLMVSLLILLDVVINPTGQMILFPVALMVISALYVDYFFVELLLKLALFGVFVVLDLMYKTPMLFRNDLLICLGVLAISSYCYGILLGIQTDSNQENRILAEKSNIDRLTGLYNKLSFEEQAHEFLDHRGIGVGAVLMIIDFDNFKHVNDSYGHLVGDQILKRFGEILSSNFRVTDVVGRVGGDEFMVLLRNSMPAEEVARKCEVIEHELNVSRIGEAGGFSCSIGVVTDEKGFTFNELYLLADDALYEAKARGKKQFVLWKSLRISPPSKKIIYIASPDESLMERVKAAYGSRYTYIQEGRATVALNEISLYQKYLDTVLFDYINLDMDEAVLRLYINSRPIFAKIPVCDVHKEL